MAEFRAIWWVYLPETTKRYRYYEGIANSKCLCAKIREY